MDFFFHCRDKPDTGALLQSLTEAHWSFMDGYADRLLVRGPTLSADGEEHTGSLHIVALAGIAETETFAYQEPFYKAGAYGAVTIHRWQDRFGRAIRDFKPNPIDPLYLILLPAPENPVTPPPPPEAWRDFAARHRDRIGALGCTFSTDGARWTGGAAIVQAPDATAADGLLTKALPDLGFSTTGLEIHRWCVGGRR